MQKDEFIDFIIHEYEYRISIGTTKKHSIEYIKSINPVIHEFDDGAAYDEGYAIGYHEGYMDK